MNAMSMLGGVIIGVLTGGITGYLATLYALRQFKAQRAFDRQLEWYERTVRALGMLLHFSQKRFTAEAGGLKMQSEEFEKEFANVEQCIREATLYAEKTTFAQLDELQEKLWEIESRHDSGESSIAIPVEIGTLTGTALAHLSRPVRRMLGLKQITSSDFKVLWE